jgi:hypothetical protein
LIPAARALAYAAAVLDDGTPVELGAALAELDPARAVDAAEVLADAGVLEPGLVLRCCQPLLRAAVLDGFSRRKRDCAHRRAAALLRARAAAAPLEQIAAQILACGPGLGHEDVETLRAAAWNPQPRNPVFARTLHRPDAGEWRKLSAGVADGLLEIPVQVAAAEPRGVPRGVHKALGQAGRGEVLDLHDRAIAGAVHKVSGFLRVSTPKRARHRTPCCAS